MLKILCEKLCDVSRVYNTIPWSKINEQCFGACLPFQNKCSASPQCHFSFFLSSAPWRLQQRRSLQHSAPGRLQWSPERKPSFSIEQSSNHVFELCPRPFPPLWNFQLRVFSPGEVLEHFLWISVDISAFSRQAGLGNCLPANVTKIEILQDLLTVNLKKRKKRRKRKIRQGCLLSLCGWHWGNGKRLICCGVGFCFRWQFLHSSSARLSEPKPLDKNRKSYCQCHLQNGTCDI